MELKNQKISQLSETKVRRITLIARILIKTKANKKQPQRLKDSKEHKEKASTRL